MTRIGAMNDQRGYTLAEMLVVCAVVGLVMAGLLGLVMSGQQAYWFGTTQVDAQQTVRVAMERMVKEIREAGYEPQTPDTNPVTCPNGTTYPLYPNGAPCYTFVPITNQGATTLTLQYNWNGSATSTHIDAGLVNDPMCPTAAACRGEQVVYDISGTDLRRQEIGLDGSPLVIARGITSLAFTYLDQDGNPTTAQDLIRIVGISMTTQTDARGAYVTMTDRVRLRNR